MAALVLYSGPATEVVSLDEAKAHLRVDHVNDDAMIAAYVQAAREHLDGRDGMLGRALVTQTWDLKLDEFVDDVELPLAPLQSVSSIKYLDSDAVEQTVDPSNYRVTGIGAWRTGRVQLASGGSWPSIGDYPEAVTIRFVCGYGTPAQVPEAIKAAIKLITEDLYDRPDKSSVLRERAYDLVRNYRIAWF